MWRTCGYLTTWSLLAIPFAGEECSLPRVGFFVAWSPLVEESLPHFPTPPNRGKLSLERHAFDTFALERPEKRGGSGIRVTVASAAHAHADADLGKIGSRLRH